MTQRIGILGGTFDPPHVGHLILGEYSIDALDLTHLLFVPAADPPHKQDRAKTPVEHRLAMLKLAIEGNSRFDLSHIDLDRPGPHYSLDTVKIVSAQFPDAELFFVMGGDSLRDLPKWHHPQELIALCKLAVMRRPGDNLNPGMHSAVLPDLERRVVMMDTPVLEISSTEIVNRLRQGKSVRYLVPDEVLGYIAEYGVYSNAVQKK
jgi:nicotinate-nucleotide adenylyltransferase